jgi:amidase
MRIAFADIDFRGHVSSPECRDGVAETADLLDAMGHKVEQAGPRIDGQSMAEAFIVIWESLAESIFTLILTEASKRRAGRLLRRLLGDWRAMRLIARIDRSKAGRESFEPFTWALADHSRRHTPAELTAARTELQRVSHVVGEFLETYDSLLTPVVAGPPLRLSEIDQNAGWDELIENLFTYVAFTPIANFTGNPAMSVPTYWTPSGLPIGAHFMGPYGDEARMLSLAGQLERARPWFDRRPPVSR